MPDRGLVLVVEDERSIADLVSLYLRRDGFGVHVEPDGPAALAAVRRLRPVAVVLDIGLPGMDGIDVCREMRASDDWTPVLFVTARDDEVDRVLGLEMGADDYVTKPFSPANWPPAFAPCCGGQQARHRLPGRTRSARSEPTSP